MIIDRAIHSIARHWLLLANLLVGIYVGLPILAPVLMLSGAEAPARVIYRVYSPLCHQLASRSFFVAGEQVAYPRELAGSQLTPIEDYMPSVPEFAGVSTDPADVGSFLLPARQFLGNETMGYKVALCQRDISMYLSILGAGLLYAVLRNRRKIRPMPFWLFLLIGLGPIALDGFSQLISQFFAGLNVTALSGLLPLRESTPLLRSATGALFGVSLVWLIYPRLNDQMAEIEEDQARKLATYGVTQQGQPDAPR